MFKLYNSCDYRIKTRENIKIEEEKEKMREREDLKAIKRELELAEKSEQNRVKLFFIISDIILILPH